MGVFGKPKNRYGWVRVIAWVFLIGILIWSALAAGLRAVSEVDWMAWSDYRSFSLLRGAELALISLLAAIVAGWLEEHDHHQRSEWTRRQEAERLRAVQREAAVSRIRETIRDALPHAEQDHAAIPVQIRVKLAEMVRAALAELDGKGKGELLHFLYDRELLAGVYPVVDLHGADCRGALLTNAHLAGICLEGADLSGAQMNGTSFEQARLSGANLGRAFLRQADLRGVILNGTNLNGLRLDGANLEGAECSPESLDRAILIETIYLDGRKVTNEKGKQYLRDKELSIVVDRL